MSEKVIIYKVNDEDKTVGVEIHIGKEKFFISYRQDLHKGIRCGKFPILSWNEDFNRTAIFDFYIKRGNNV